MYRPAAFDVPDLGELHDLVDASGPADLVSLTPDGLTATVLPMLLDRTAGPFGTLNGHLARANEHWRAVSPGVESLAILGGPDAYVSPSLYAAKARTAKVVPTWNYITVHARGELVIHDDAAWVRDLVGRLTERHESGRAEPWAVEDAPEDFVAAQLRGIVGVELRIARLEGVRKLSQNRAADDVAGVITGLRDGTPAEQTVAGAMLAPSSRPAR